MYKLIKSFKRDYNKCIAEKDFNTACEIGLAIVKEYESMDQHVSTIVLKKSATSTNVAYHYFKDELSKKCELEIPFEDMIITHIQLTDKQEWRFVCRFISVDVLERKYKKSIRDFDYNSACKVGNTIINRYDMYNVRMSMMILKQPSNSAKEAYHYFKNELHERCILDIPFEDMFITHIELNDNKEWCFTCWW